MILTGKSISDAVYSGRITISPFDPRLLNPNSYNYRLGESLLEITSNPIDPKKPVQTIRHRIPSEGFLLQPNRTYLGHTLETIGSGQYVTSLIGRSSLGRLGLFLQITADLGQLGNAHCWTLELKAVQPLRVYPGMRIGQVSFWKTNGELRPPYMEGYTSFSLPHESRYAEIMA